MRRTLLILITVFYAFYAALRYRYNITARAYIRAAAYTVKWQARQPTI